MSWLIGLTGTIALTAFAHIQGHYREKQWYVYFFKPLTTSLIILLAVTISFFDTTTYRLAILAGLFFCLFGDIALMLPKDRFIPGLVSFLIGHIFYIVAFSQGWTGFHTGYLVLSSVICFGFLTILWPHLGKMKSPVTIYSLVIGALLWCAFERWHALSDITSFIGLVGVILFVTSDSILAFNRFVQQKFWAEGTLLVLYYSAQVLIVLSIGLA